MKNALDIPRRLFLGTAVGALALRPSRVAQADTAFINFSFAADGAPAARTMPERLSDIINVKDWGAKGNNLNDDTAAIQAAIDYCININGGGKVFFPAGSYKITGSGLAVGHATIDTGVQLIGSGMFATSLFSSVSGFTVSGGGRAKDCLECVSNMTVQNNSGIKSSGAIQLTRECASCASLSIIGWFGVDASGCTGAYLSGVFCIGSGTAVPFSTAADATTHGLAANGTIGIQGSDGAYISDCRVTGYNIAYALKGSGATMVADTAEVNNIGLRLGWSNAGVATAYACSVLGFQGEKTCIGMELYDCQGCYITGVNWEGTSYPYPDAPATATASGTTVTVTTRGSHNIPSSPIALVLTVPAGWQSSSAYTLCTVDNSTQFHYTAASAPGGGAVSCTWSYPQQYGLRLRKALECVISGYSGPLGTAHASVDLDFGTVFNSVSDASNAQLRNVVFENLYVSHGWAPPVTKRNLAGCKFIHCTGELGSNVQVTTVTQPILTFADLPGQTGVFQTGPLEGQIYSISDGNNATFGGAQAGGGGGHYLVRYDGFNWVRIG